MIVVLLCHIQLNSLTFMDVVVFTDSYINQWVKM